MPVKLMTRARRATPSRPGPSAQPGSLTQMSAWWHPKMTSSNSAEATRLLDGMDAISRLGQAVGDDRIAELTELLRDIVRERADLEDRHGLAYELVCWG